jgi:hypothetical protein
MTTTTTQATTTQAATDVDLIAALDASPDFVTVNSPGHLADLLGITTPNQAALAILGDTALASGRERGIIAAGILERIVPDGVEIEELNLGTDRKTRGVFLHADGVDHIGMHFLDGTACVWIHIDGDDETSYDGLATPAEMFDLVRGYYGA